MSKAKHSFTFSGNQVYILLSEEHEAFGAVARHVRLFDSYKAAVDYSREYIGDRLIWSSIDSKHIAREED